MFHFPALFLTPDFAEEAVESGHYRLTRRLWQTTIFDLTTLATKHTLRLPYQVMDVFLGRCNLEIGVEAKNQDEASVRLQALRLALYSEYVSPFIVPFGTTYSVNQYSGINSRDSKALSGELPEGLRKGLTSDTDKVEAWPVELSFQCLVDVSRLQITPETFTRASKKAYEWEKIASGQPSARAFGQAVLSAPLVLPPSQSVLHMWCAVESLFPSVATELSFRVALYMTQLAASNRDRKNYFERVKKGYNMRSKIAHGAKQDVSGDEWKEAWGFVLDALNSIFRNGIMPKEEALLNDLFGV